MTDLDKLLAQLAKEENADDPAEPSVWTRGPNGYMVKVPPKKNVRSAQFRIALKMLAEIAEGDAGTPSGYHAEHAVERILKMEGGG